MQQRTAFEVAFSDSARREAALAVELQHRVGNILATLCALTRRASDSATTVGGYAQSVYGRILSLSRIQSLLMHSGGGSVDLEAVLRGELEAQVDYRGECIVRGPKVTLSSKAAEVLGMAVHELARNALKHGALAERGGQISLTWDLACRDDAWWLILQWLEKRNNPLSPSPSVRSGFGMELIERRIPYELQGSAMHTVDENGAYCVIEFPLRDGASILETGPPRNIRDPAG